MELPAQGQNQNLTKGLFKTYDPSKPINSFITKGSLITFNYSMWKHDPYPLIIVSDFNKDGKLRGVNLHYLTFPYIKTLLKNYCEKNVFSYSAIRTDKYVVSSFRSYKWSGIRNIKKLDCNLILSVMGIVRSFDPSQVEAIRKSIQDQINTLVNTPASDLENTELG